MLLVDDEPAVANAVARFLRTRGCDVFTAATGSEALDVVARQKLTMVICDVGLPDVSGIDLVPEILALEPYLAIVMCTAADDAATATTALTRGALDYLVKPVQVGALDAAVERALLRRAALVERESIERIIRDEMAARTAVLERERGGLRAMSVGVAESLISAMEAKDVYLRGHSQRVAALGASIAEEMGLEAEVVEQVRMAGRLHDVGKIGIRESVLNKPGPLAPDEYEHVKTHVAIGMEILAPLQHLGTALDFVHDHHERFDGGGYPRGLAGERISIGGRILAAADMYDAITSARPYRDRPMTQAEALGVMRDGVGTLLDPRVFDALERVLGRRRSLVFLDLVE